MAENERIKLSIVIAAWNGNTSLRECLESLKNQTDAAATEIIVVSNFPVNFSESEVLLPAKFTNLSETATVPELRCKGIALARGEIVALVEDQCLFDAHWCEEIKKAHESSNTVVGGSVENASVERALDWAVYFYDYGKYMLPNRAGATAALSGMNVSYKRAVLEEIRDVYKDGFFETFVNEELIKRGHQLYLEPAAIVYHHKNYSLKRAAEHCYHLARSYAAQRVAGGAFSKRAFLIAVSIVLPVLLPVRIVSATVKKGRHLKELTGAMPALILLMTIWSYGEFCGYLLGAGNSAGEWR
ncbi:MAG: glycosyltransferase [Actinomycetota bacterium]